MKSAMGNPEPVLVQIPHRNRAGNPFFRSSSEKNDPRIGVLAGFIGVGWAKLCGEISLNSRGFEGH
jgi:hypothetical protein